MIKTNIGLVEYAKAQLGNPYWYGTYGKPASASLYNSKKKQYPQYYLWKYDADYKGIKVHDCVGLIKGYIWSESPTDTAPKYNKEQDKSANGMKKACKVRGKINTMPENAGLLVFYNGHVGVYIGNGEVIEARGHKYGVVKTQLNKRGWKEWGECPYILYIDKPIEKPQITVRDWQLSAIADGFKFPEYGADGIWGRECEAVAKKAIIKKRVGVYKYQNLTKIAQRLLGVVADGKCGTNTANAIKEYQAKNGLEADGEIGLITWRKLMT